MLFGPAAVLGLLLPLLVVSWPTSLAADEHDLCTAIDPTPPAPTIQPLRSYRPGFNGPARLAVDSLGRIYATDSAAGRVVVRDPDGRVLEDRRDLGTPVAIAVDEAGAAGRRVYLSDSRRGSVTAYDPDWQALFQLGQGEGEFRQPTGLAVDPPSGRIFVADGAADEIRVYDAAGAPLFAFGAPGAGPGQFKNPAALHLDATAGELLVADQLNFRIQIFDLNGNFLCRIGDAAGSRPGSIFGLRTRLFTAPQGLWVDGLGRIYVTDSSEGRVRVIDRAGTQLVDIGGFGRRPGELLTPLDLVIDPQNRLFVAAFATARLEVYGLEGFADPERFAPAVVAIEPALFDHLGSGPVLAVVEVPGYRIDALRPESIVANGVPADPSSAVIGDRDGDHEPDLTVAVPRAALAATLPAEGPARIGLRGSMAALDFDGSAEIEVRNGVLDTDGDGVLDDLDLCPETPADGPVDAEGCSLDQRCPCAATADGAAWKNHGAYVKCVSHGARDFAAAGLLATAGIGKIVSSAAKSRCGKGAK